MGWIDETTYENIKIVGKLRNLAAHDAEHFRFENKNVIKLLRKISTIADNSEEDLLDQSAMGQMHAGSEIVYHVGGVTAKVQFIQAVSNISDDIEVFAHYARNPPPGSVRLKRGDLVKCSYGWEQGKMAIVLSQARSNGMVECKVLGFGSFSNEAESKNLYCYDLELLKFPQIPDHCELEVGDLVEFGGTDTEFLFSNGVVESIDTEFRTVTARSSGLLKGVFRAFWGELRKVGH
jgi:hypothetical protein